MHFKIDDSFMAHVADRGVLQVKSVLVALHVSLPGEDFIADITRKLATLAFMYFRDVHPEVLLITKVFVADPAHELFGWRLRGGFVLLRARH